MKSPLELARQLDLGLGDARDPALLFSFARRVSEDETEHYPAEALSALSQLELHHHYVPTACGGALRSFDQLGALLRVVAGRDLTLAIGHAVSFLGSMGVWLSGTEGQQRTLAKAMLAGERVSLALTEKTCGSDLLGMGTTAVQVDDGFQLNGEKWMVNGPSRNRFVTVYAKTGLRGGPRCYSLFLLDKQAVSGACESLGKIRTLGVRGADISGLRLEDATVPDHAIVGNEGEGFETVLKALQLSRTLCGPLSLGALDTALDTTLRFATERIVYGKPVTALLQSQKLLCEAWGQGLVADSLSGLALRALQAVPGQASVHSAIVKYLVPTLVEQSFQKLAVVHGARYYLRDAHDAGIFQKMFRDQLLIGLFDGSTQVNLFTLSHQLRALLGDAGSRARPADWIRHDAPLPDFSWQGLSLSSRGQDDLMAGFDTSAAHLGAWLAQRPQDEAAAWLDGPLTTLVEAKRDLVEGVGAMSPALIASGDPQSFEWARRYCVLAAASGVLAEWQFNAAVLGTTLAQPCVLALALKALAAQLGDQSLLPTPCYQAAFARLQARHAAGNGTGLYPHNMNRSE